MSAPENILNYMWSLIEARGVESPTTLETNTRADIQKWRMPASGGAGLIMFGRGHEIVLLDMHGLHAGCKETAFRARWR